MIKVFLKEHTGTLHEVAGTEGDSLMKVAIDNMVPGIDADCGGDCACGTCHVIVAKDWLNKVGEPESEEEALIGMTPDNESGSRLACQIVLKEDLDGLEVALPEFQM